MGTVFSIIRRTAKTLTTWAENRHRGWVHGRIEQVEAHAALARRDRS